MKLVVLIPAFNEQKTIAPVIRTIPKKIRGIKKIEVLVVDDGSTDNTVKNAKSAKANKIVSHGINRGLGVAFRTGIEHALQMQADIIVNIDADGQFNSQDIPKIANPVLEGEADFVTCSRFKDKGLSPEMPWIKKTGNKIFTKIISFLAKQKFTDTQCGFRAYSRETALRLNLFGKHTYTQEALLDAGEKGLRIKEVACRVKGQRKGKSRVVSSWFVYSVKALAIIIRTIRDRKPLAFFGGIGYWFFSTGFGIAFALWIRLLLIHKIDPYMWLVYASIMGMVLGFLLMILALIADMNARQRKITEETLYRVKKAEFKK